MEGTMPKKGYWSDSRLRRPHYIAVAIGMLAAAAITLDLGADHPSAIPRSQAAPPFAPPPIPSPQLLPAGRVAWPPFYKYTFDQDTYRAQVLETCDAVQHSAPLNQDAQDCLWHLLTASHTDTSSGAHFGGQYVYFRLRTDAVLRGDRAAYDR
jgi:hypothetical protein